MMIWVVWNHQIATPGVSQSRVTYGTRKQERDWWRGGDMGNVLVRRSSEPGHGGRLGYVGRGPDE